MWPSIECIAARALCGGKLQHLITAENAMSSFLLYLTGFLLLF